MFVLQVIVKLYLYNHLHLLVYFYLCDYLLMCYVHE